MSILTRAVEMLQGLKAVRAVGLAGSHALGAADAYSDLDLQVFTTDSFPNAQERREAYLSTQGVDVGQLSHVVSAEFEKPPYSQRFIVDWLRIDGVKCDVLWIGEEALAAALARVQKEPDHPEAAAVLAQLIKPLYDPHALIQLLKARCPTYTDYRARRKTGNCFGWARWFLCQWGVLAKAARRGDVVAYQKAETQLIANLIAALYALNRAWMLDERRLRLLTRSFAVVPPSFVERIEHMILRRGDCETLAGSHRELLDLYRQLALAADRRHPDWNLPTEWPEWSGQDGISAPAQPT